MSGLLQRPLRLDTQHECAELSRLCDMIDSARSRHHAHLAPQRRCSYCPCRACWACAEAQMSKGSALHGAPDALPRLLPVVHQTCDAASLRSQAAACHLGAAHGHVGLETLPFLLVQGPPGTGKTHTVKGVLNVWHLVHYQRYYDSLVATLSNPEKAQESLRLALDRK